MGGMKNTTTLKAIVLAASVGISTSALANPDITELLDKAKAGQNGSKADLFVSSKNGKGTITYKGEKVWKGPVKGDLKAFSKVAAAAGEDGEQENIEYAAVWDGKKLVWENRSGAADALEPERLKAERELQKLKDELEDALEDALDDKLRDLKN